MGPSGDRNPAEGQQQPIAIHPHNALHLHQHHHRESSQTPPTASGQRSYQSASQKAGAHQPATRPYKLPPLWSAGSTPPASIVPDSQSSSQGAMAMKAVSQSHCAGTASMTAQRKMPSKISYLPTPSLQTKPHLHAATQHIVGLAAFESSSSRASSPVAPLAAPNGSPTVTSLPSYSNRSTTRVQTAIPDITTIASASAPSSSASSADAEDVENTSPALEGVKQYLDSQFHDHPAHMVKCKAASVKAMTGESGQPPTRTDIKKGLHTLSEQRRRWSINEGYEQLRAIVPHCDNGRSSGPMPKAAVLSRAANYIGDLTMYITQLRDALKEKDDRIARMIESSSTMARGEPATASQLHLPTRKVSEASVSTLASSTSSGTIRDLQSPGMAPGASASIVTPSDQPGQSSASASLIGQGHRHAITGSTQSALPTTIDAAESTSAKRARSSTFPAGMDDLDVREGFLPPPASHLPSVDVLGPSYEHYSSPSAFGRNHAQLPPLKRKRSPLVAELSVGHEGVGVPKTTETKTANGLCAWVV